MSVFFFFSSRRRHTRFDCDWSSDVCSSDLDHAAAAARIAGHRGQAQAVVGRDEARGNQRVQQRDGSRRIAAGVGHALGSRSEEHTSELQSQSNLVCRLLLEKKKKKKQKKCYMLTS